MEKAIFFILAFIMFIVIFTKFIKRNDSVYLYIVFLEFIGLAVRFIGVLNNIEYNNLIIILMYVISIIIPIAVIFLEQNSVFASESICIMQVRILLKLKRNDVARRKLINLISKHQNSYYAHKLLAEIYEKEGKLEESIDEYVRAVDINGKDYDSYYQIAFLLHRTEKNIESEKMLKELLNKNPEYYQAAELLGTVLYDQEKFSEAVSVYQEALKNNPERYELYYGLGMAYTRLNDFQTAKEYYEKAAMINSMLFHAKISIAQIALIAGELEEAENRFIECLGNKETEPDAYYYLAIVCMLKGEQDKAVGYINIAIELDKRIYKRASAQDVFKPVMDQVRNVQNRIHRYHLNAQEIKTKKHLEDTFNLIQKMKKNDNNAVESDEKKIELDGNEREF